MDDIVERVLRELCFHWEGGPLPSERDAREAHAELGRDRVRTMVTLLRTLVEELEIGRTPPSGDGYELAEYRAGRDNAADGMIALFRARADALEAGQSGHTGGAMRTYLDGLRARQLREEAERRAKESPAPSVQETLDRVLAGAGQTAEPTGRR